jgi:hypothetical protein
VLWEECLEVCPLLEVVQTLKLLLANSLEQVQELLKPTPLLEWAAAWVVLGAWTPP